MIKRAFTLAEVLITLTMIGIIASMTLPTLNNNIVRQQMGPALMKAINVLESANKAVLQNEGARHLGEIANAVGYLNQVLGRVASLTETQGPNYTGRINQMDDFGVTTPDGMTYYAAAGVDAQSGQAEVAAGNISQTQMGQYYRVWVDVNGASKGPNIMGRDLFELNVDLSGQVLARGSNAWAIYVGGEESTWEDTCTNLTGGDNQNPRNCAGAIVENNGRVTYQY